MGGAYEITDGTVKKYYSIAGMMVAMNVQDGETWKLSYLFTDHLGSTVAVMTQNQSEGWDTSQQRYLPFGEVRTDIGSISQTDFGYTGQRKLDDDTGGIMDYKARFYSPYLNRFLQPDSIVLNAASPQELNRYAYVGNNPLTYYDPGGHFKCINKSSKPITESECKAIVEKWLNLLETKGGKEGKDLAKAFRDADSNFYAAHNGMSGTDEDLITITIVDEIPEAEGEGDVRARYAEDGENTFTFEAEIVTDPDPNDVNSLAIVGVFGHEIDHLRNPMLSGTQQGEIHAYGMQYEIYKSMGIADPHTKNGDIWMAMRIGKHWKDSDEELKNTDDLEKIRNLPWGTWERVWQDITSLFNKK
jgi:RHS repeat-associated protein